MSSADLFSSSDSDSPILNIRENIKLDSCHVQKNKQRTLKCSLIFPDEMEWSINGKVHKHTLSDDLKDGDCSKKLILLKQIFVDDLITQGEYDQHRKKLLSDIF